MAVKHLFGGLAIEAHSRGAAKVVTVEKYPQSLAIVAKNLEEMNIGDEIEVVKMDVMRYLQSFSGVAFDIILVDPPFTQKLAHPTMEILKDSSVWGSETVISVEYSKHEPLMTSYVSKDEPKGTLTKFDERDYGDKLVAFFRRAE